MTTPAALSPKTPLDQLDQAIQRIGRHRGRLSGPALDAFDHDHAALLDAGASLQQHRRALFSVSEGTCVTTSLLSPPGCAPDTLDPPDVASRSDATTLTIAAATHVGHVRSNNEDAVDGRLIPAADGAPLGVAVLCDGLGGHPFGEVASRHALHHALEELATAARLGASDWAVHLRLAAHRAHGSLLAAQAADRPLRGMATTFVAAVCDGRRVAWAWAGDSRMYLFRGGRLRPLTTDHAYADGGLASALGTPESPLLDAACIDVLPGDRLLLCSDGLHGYVPELRITAVLEDESTASDAARALVCEALGAGGRDNVSVVVLDLAASGARFQATP